jgi:hypothetical protein
MMGSGFDELDLCTTLNSNLAVTLLSADGQQKSINYGQLSSISV